MDVVITYGNVKYIVELKIWNGEAYRVKGIEQLTQYIDEQGVKEGYLLTFNFNKTKNIVLRYLLNDTKDLADKATEILENTYFIKITCHLPRGWHYKCIKAMKM